MSFALYRNYHVPKWLIDLNYKLHVKLNLLEAVVKNAFFVLLEQIQCHSFPYNNTVSSKFLFVTHTLLLHGSYKVQIPMAPKAQIYANLTQTDHVLK